MLKDIPSSFQCLGHTINVVWVDKLHDDEGDAVWGLTDFNSNIITLCRPTPEDDPEILRQTFWHEAMHVILHLLNRFELRDDDPLVDLMGSAIHQMTKTAKYSKGARKGNGGAHTRSASKTKSRGRDSRARQ